MNLYQVNYQRYTTTEKCNVVASTVAKAYERAMAYIKKKHYSGHEITSIEKSAPVDAIAK